MSGDVQPRKRKDKKKRKDEDGYSPLNDDVNIHVHKEGGTGGNICAKIVFFFLFSTLIVLIGLIIKENQGLSELEEYESESRYSQIFEGWVDKTPDEHEEEHSHDLSHEHDDHEEEEDASHYESEEDNVEETEEAQSEEIDEDDEQNDDESTIRSEEETIEETEEEDEVPESEEVNTVEEDEENTVEDDQEDTEEVDEQIDSEEKDKEETEEDDSDTKEEEESKEKSTEDKDGEGISEEDKSSVKSKEEVKKYVPKESAKPTTDDVKEEPHEEQGELKQESLKEKQVEEEKEKLVKDETEKQSSGNVSVGEETDSDKEDYEHSNITNQDDYKIKEDIDAAQEHLHKNTANANKMFGALLDQYPLSPRTLYGKGKALDILAEEKHSNELLQQALVYYARALSTPNVPDPLFVIVAERYIDRARFMGQYKKAVAVHWQLIERFPYNSTYMNNLAVTYLTINLVEEARSVLKKVLSKWPNDGFALVHYGFILKTTDNNLEESVHYMEKGLRTKEPGVIDGRFYFHLGDALTRLGKNKEAMKLYEEGVQEKLFMSKYQRSLYNVQRLTAKPWWEPEDLSVYQKLFIALKDNWLDIRKEGLSALDHEGYFRDEAENLKDTGTWKQLELYARGQKSTKNCAKSPITCGIIQSFSDVRNCRRGQTKFSVMHPGTHVWPHCGPTNCRLRIHLGLKVPPKTFIRVAEETRSWKEGDIIIFDDSFEHEVWHNGSEYRLVLIIDVWHPELTTYEKKSLSAI